MSAPHVSTPATPTPAQLAKGALRRMAQERLEPTPENYRKAYDAEAVALGLPPTEMPQPVAISPAPVVSSPTDEGPAWAELIGRVARGLERSNRQWTVARKKDSLQRVLSGSRQSAVRLQQRLTQLVQAWDSDSADNPVAAEMADGPPPSAEAAADAPPQPTAGPTSMPASADEIARVTSELTDTLAAALPPAEAGALEAHEAVTAAVARWLDAHGTPCDATSSELVQACAQARRVIEHRHHLVDQLVDLCRTLTDSLVDLAEDDSWVRGQCEAMRAELDDGLSHRGTRRMHQLLEDTRLRQQTLRQEREAARQALKQLIHQMLSEISALGHATDRFQGNLERYADTIGQADSLESLTGVVREMVEESRAVHGVISQAQERLQHEHTRATELTERVQRLEDEIRQLSQEVSTDPLTQIANRRGMVRAFEAERARVERQGAPLSVGLLDVDNFKKLNDTLGHHTGDEALKFLARRVSESLRPSDAVARYGGEEFVVLLPDTPVEEGQQVLTRLQRQLSAEFFTQDDNKVFITFSAGVTQYRLGESIEVALDRADMGLYEAKRTGKNRTCIS